MGRKNGKTSKAKSLVQVVAQPRSVFAIAEKNLLRLLHEDHLVWKMNQNLTRRGIEAPPVEPDIVDCVLDILRLPKGGVRGAVFDRWQNVREKYSKNAALGFLRELIAATAHFRAVAAPAPSSN